jgi:hypothetical protein
MDLIQKFLKMWQIKREKDILRMMLPKAKIPVAKFFKCRRKALSEIAWH